ncbi:MAG TPA: bluetail domain-containing putative surface protein [Rhizomicrobium sp.]|jgi:autotransporter-associated beta strand protein
MNGASHRYFAEFSPAALQPRHPSADLTQPLSFFTGSLLPDATTSPIDTNQPFYLQSDVGAGVLPDFQGGTLRVDQAGATDNNNYTVETFATNTIDAFGHTITFTGTFSGAGPLTIADSAGGGAVIVSNTSVLGGTVTIASGATLQWGDASGGFLLSSGNSLTDDGSLVMNFGGNGLSDTLQISGSGKLTLQSGSLTDEGVSTYTGTTLVDAGAIFLMTDSASIADSSVLADNGKFDISGMTVGVSIDSLTGSGLFSLGGVTLTISSASSTFSGVLADDGVFGGTGGSLTIAAGTETLTGTNTFTGATTIDAGAVLQLAGHGTVAGDVTDNGSILFAYSGAVTAGNNFSGSGSAEIAAGTAILTGLGTLGGTVTVDNGATLQWGDGNPAFLVGGGNIVVDNGALVLDFAGGGIGGAIPISGSGNLTIESGSLNNNGASTYTGTTSIGSAGLLALTSGGSIANSSIVADNGKFDISGETAGASITALTGSGFVSLGAQMLTITDASGSFFGVFADGGLSNGTDGSLTIAGGTQTLSGTSTFTGATTIDPGATLQLGAGGTTGSVAGSIADNGLVRFDYSGAVTVSNTFFGSGNVQVVAGTVIETSASEVGGSLTIDKGATLQWGNGVPAFLAGASVIDNGALVLDFGGGAVDTSLSIFGSGKLILESGSLFAFGANTYTGNTIIDAGALLAIDGSGSIASSSVVADAGKLDISATTVGTSITALTGSGVVTLGGQTLTITKASGTFSGAMADGGGSVSGTGGSLTVAAGTETLTGTNTFTGATTINTGATLQLGTGGTAGTVSGSVVLDFSAKLLVDHSAAGSETLALTLGGSDVVAGGKGSETFLLAPGDLDNSDVLNGGKGTAIDRLVFDMAGTVASSAFAHVSHIEELVLANGTNAITLTDAMVGSADDNHVLTVIGGTGDDTVNAAPVLTVGNSVRVSGGDGNDTLTGGRQADTLNGGAGNDTLFGNLGDDILLPGPGNDTVNGDAGNDLIRAGNAFTAADRFDGGVGTDTLQLDGDYSAGVTFLKKTLVNVEIIQLVNGFSYKLTTVDATVASGETMTVDGSALTAGHVLIFNGAAETDGSFVLHGGAGNDTLIGGVQADTLIGGGGADVLTPGGGGDIIAYKKASDSTSVQYDTVHGFSFAQDKFDIPGSGTPITGIDAAIATGALSTATFDHDLAAALSGHLKAGHAELFTPTSGTLAHQTFLVIDLNGTAGYQANADLVIHLIGQTGTLAVSDFI